MNKPARNYGIDLLRVISLFGVIILHILGHGGVLSTAKTGLNFAAAWFLEIVAYPAVNCFVLISGFVGYRGEKYYPKLKNIISLFFTVLFYSALICLTVKIIYPNEIGIKDIIESFLPITTKQYWFFTSYFAMFLVSPMLNFFVNKANVKMLKISCIVILFFAVSALFKDPFSLNNGYSFVWFSFLYLIGASIKKYDITKKLSNRFCVLCITAALMTTWLLKVVCESVNIEIFGVSFSKLGNLLISYCSPTIYLMAIGVVCIFEKIQTKDTLNRIISFFSSAAFSVYLIHDNNYIRKLLISNNFTFANDYNPVIMISIVLLSAIGIFLVCVLIDKMRTLLFHVLRIKILSEKTEQFIKWIIRRFLVFSKIG